MVHENNGLIFLEQPKRIMGKKKEIIKILSSPNGAHTPIVSVYTQF